MTDSPPMNFLTSANQNITNLAKKPVVSSALIFALRSTLRDMATMAPGSDTNFSPGSSSTRSIAKPGLCVTSWCILPASQGTGPVALQWRTFYFRFERSVPPKGCAKQVAIENRLGSAQCWVLGGPPGACAPAPQASLGGRVCSVL